MAPTRPCLDFFFFEDSESSRFLEVLRLQKKREKTATETAATIAPAVVLTAAIGGGAAKLRLRAALGAVIGKFDWVLRAHM